MLQPEDIAKLSLSEAGETAKTKFAEKKYAEAIPLFKSRLELIGPPNRNNVNEVADIHYCLGQCYQYGFNYDDSVKHYEIALTLFSSYYQKPPENHPEVKAWAALKLFDIGMACASPNAPAQKEALLIKSLFKVATDLFKVPNQKPTFVPGPEYSN